MTNKIHSSPRGEEVRSAAWHCHSLKEDSLGNVGQGFGRAAFRWPVAGWEPGQSAHSLCRVGRRGNGARCLRPERFAFSGAVRSKPVNNRAPGDPRHIQSRRITRSPTILLGSTIWSGNPMGAVG
jgi:hypothetical protein